MATAQRATLLHTDTSELSLLNDLLSSACFQEHICALSSGYHTLTSLGVLSALQTVQTQVELLREVFDNIDKEGKGYFTKDELFFIMESMGGSPTPQELDAVMFELDSNNDHVVDFPEFLAKFYVSSQQQQQQGSHCHAAHLHGSPCCNGRAGSTAKMCVCKSQLPYTYILEPLHPTQPRASFHPLSHTQRQLGRTYTLGVV